MKQKEAEMDVETKIIKSGSSTKDYYKVLNGLYSKIFNKSMMLHYPYYLSDDEDLQKRQENLVEHCVRNRIPETAKEILDVGCGNGSQTSFIDEIIDSGKIVGIDLNEANIDNAIKHFSSDKISFRRDDSQELSSVKSSSVDTVICIESAFHYPDKAAFLRSVHRVLNTGGTLILADILSQSYRKGPFLRNWKKKMSYYHWILKDYLDTMEMENFEVEYKEDMTTSIINGYKGYSSWLDKSTNLPWHQLLAVRMFLHIQVILNVILLKRRRKYYLFVCRKV